MKCTVCQGKNVVKVVDDAACQSAEQKRILKAYISAEEVNEECRRESEAERRMEAGMLGDYDTFYG